jgi:phage-related protein
MEDRGKVLVIMGGVLHTPPMSTGARRETGFLLRQLQEGEPLGLPHSRPMPVIGGGCHELRVTAENGTWRTLYYLDSDAVVILGVFKKKTKHTPRPVLDECKRRLKVYLAARREEKS